MPRGEYIDPATTALETFPITVREVKRLQKRAGEWRLIDGVHVVLDDGRRAQLALVWIGPRRQHRRWYVVVLPPPPHPRYWTQAYVADVRLYDRAVALRAEAQRLYRNVRLRAQRAERISELLFVAADAFEEAGARIEAYHANRAARGLEVP